MAKGRDQKSRHAKLRRLTDDHLDQVVGGVQGHGRKKSQHDSGAAGQQHLHDAAQASADSARDIATLLPAPPATCDPGPADAHDRNPVEVQLHESHFTLSVHGTEFTFPVPATGERIAEQAEQILGRAEDHLKAIEASPALPQAYAFK